jgi:membrane fusion protein, heavy metal efflux system
LFVPLWIDGVITARNLSVGEVVKENAPILTVADLSTVWVELNLYAKDLGVVKPGQKATVKTATVAASADGKVSYVGALIGNQTRTAPARIVLPNRLLACPSKSKTWPRC